jgi:uncharacterized membrane protein YhaH (DUF805 family)
MAAWIVRDKAKAMNPAAILIYLFDWRGVMSRAAYRRNLSILFLVDLLIGRLGLLSESASYGWMAVAAAMALSFDARRYHDMGRSAAWIVWANVISAVVAIVIFQFIPNVLEYIPLPQDWRVDAAGEAIFWRFVVPSIVGVALGNVVQSLWLMSAGAATGANPYAATSAGARAAEGDDGPNEAALQAIIDRHMAAPQSQPAKPATFSAPRPDGLPERPRQFGRRGR